MGTLPAREDTARDQEAAVAKVRAKKSPPRACGQSKGLANSYEVAVSRQTADTACRHPLVHPHPTPYFSAIRRSIGTKACTPAAPSSPATASSPVLVSEETLTAADEHAMRHSSPDRARLRDEFEALPVPTGLTLGGSIIEKGVPLSTNAFFSVSQNISLFLFFFDFRFFDYSCL